jgi:signal transduction histidine kinase/ActR/RegA family two-component response regulator
VTSVRTHTASPLREYTLPVVVLLVSLAATTAFALQMRRTIAAQDDERFAFAADALRDSIRDRIETYVAMLRAAAGLQDARPDLGASDFREFVERLELQSRYPGIQGIGFSRRIDAASLPGIVATRRAAGDRDFRVWPEHQRDEYHAIVHLEPLDRRNRAAIGYDMFTEPTRREAMARARDSGEPAASGVVTLVQEIDEERQPGFLIYLPVYEGGRVPPSVTERRRLLTGFVYSPFRAGDLFEGILGSNPRPRAGFALFDGSPESGTLLHRTTAEAPGAMRTTRTIDVAGRQWTAQIFSTPALGEGSRGLIVPMLGAGGSAIALLLTGLVWMQARARVQAEQSERNAADASRVIQELLDRERSARAEAERVSRMKDEFLASLSHELRTPLNAVIGWAHLIQRGHLTADKTRHAIDTIERNAQVQARLVEDLLDMSRIVSGRVQIELRTVDLRHIVQESVGVVRPTADARGARLDVMLGPEPVMVKADAQRLQQVFWNVLSNAVKFTPSGGRITVTMSTDDAHARVAIADTGIGIDPEFLPFVFDRFSQADGSFTRRHGGLGLGLSIVRSLVEMHAGTVEAHSEGPGRGATFVIRLPRIDGAPADERGSWADQATVAHALNGRTVLVVDDNADARALVGEVLEPLGARVRAASSADEALAQLRVGAFDLVISDIGMPGMDGFDFLRAVRQLPAASGGRVPALALSAHASDADRARTRDAGYALHLAKPFHADELVAACASLLAMPIDRT